MGRIITLLSGSAGVWILIGALLTASATGAAGGYFARGVIDAPVLAHQEAATATAQKETAQCVAKHEAARADSAEDVIGQISAATVAMRGAFDVLNAKAVARDRATNDFLKELANAPVTKTCGTSPAELAYRRSVSEPASEPAAAP